jgi:hypothetical protein
VGDILRVNNQQNNKADTKRPKRPFAKSDLEAVLKAATKSLKKEQGEKESGETSESHHLCFCALPSSSTILGNISPVFP